MSRKKAIRSATSITTPRNATSNDARAQRPARERLKSSVLEELWSIWRADPRVPSFQSRRSWAISRNANPRLVDNWFLRRRTCAKKAGQPTPDGLYDLPLVPLVVPKREQSATPVKPKPEAISDLLSDDTGMLVYPPDSDGSDDLEAFPDTVSNYEDTFIELHGTETCAYKEVLWQLERHHFQPEPSTTDLCAAKDCYGENAPLFENPSYLVCSQGRGNLSDFTCILCSAESTQDEVPSDSGTMSDYDSGGTLMPYPYPDTLWELSATPFSFRSPPIVLADITDSSVDNWAIVEDELARLVNNGELDFSFLHVPHLASMELLD